MKVIQIDGNSKLVEYIDGDGNYRRCTLPVDEYSIEQGIPYGVPFENFVNHPDIPNELRRRGVWTIQDLEQKRQVAYGAIQAAYGQDLAMIIKLAKKEVSGNE